jgi:hypothetical protein
MSALVVELNASAKVVSRAQVMVVTARRIGIIDEWIRTIDMLMCFGQI